MNAIAGIWPWRAPLARDLLQQILSGVASDAATLASTRTMSLAQQSVKVSGALVGFPLVDGARAVTACGRIDNLPGLRTALGLPQEVAVARVLLAAYARWGHEMARKILGDFAIAVRDEGEDVLYLFRDRFGAVPLFTAHGPWGIAFAGSPRVLLRLPDVAGALDEQHIARYVADLPPDPASTFHLGIRAVPAAHVAVVRSGSVSMTRYWRLDPEPELVLRDEREYVFGFREHLARAVERCAPAECPVAIALSGGLDSSSVAGVAGRLLGKEVETFTAVFPDLPSCDERSSVEHVVASLGARPTYSPMRAGFGPEPRALARHADDPVVLGWYPLFLQEFGAARAAAHQVVLTGSLGDAVGGGTLGWLHELFVRGEFAKLAGELLGRSPARASRAVFGLTARALFPRAFHSLNRYRVRREIRVRFPGLRYVPSALSRRWGLEEQAVDVATKLPEASSRRELSCLLESSWPAGELGVIRWCGAQSGVVARHPFADTELVEYVVRLPLHIRLRHGLSRWVLREAMSGVLPDIVRLRRTKTFFDAFYQRQIPLWLETTGSPDWRDARPFLEPRAIARALKAQPRTYPELRALWTCGTLRLWLNREKDDHG